MDLWFHWCNEQISKDGGVYSILSRKQAIWDFCFEGLQPFLRYHGYDIGMPDKDFHLAMLRLLFALYNGKRVVAKGSLYTDTEHHYTYCHRIDTQAWQDFWKGWEELDDFQGYAYSVQYILPEILWTWIAVERSAPFEAIEKELDDIEEEAKGKDDPYLQESSKRDYNDRHW
jgi:hypothetical protein